MAQIDTEIQAIAKLIEGLYKSEIRKKGLVDSGELITSLKVMTSKKSTGYRFSVSAVTYFKFIDEKYNITKDLRLSSEWKAILKRIENANSIYIKEQVLKELQDI